MNIASNDCLFTLKYIYPKINIYKMRNLGIVEKSSCVPT